MCLLWISGEGPWRVQRRSIFRLDRLLASMRLGLCLNDQMDDFSRGGSRPNAFGLVQSDRNLPEIGKRPLSSMSPTIVLDSNGRLFAVAGASGGPKIITGTMQVLLNAMSGMSAGRSVDCIEDSSSMAP